MKRALVLCGGGSKGAYEAGFIKALNELNIHFDAVYGTSIGALNGCLVASDQIDLLDNLWNDITLNHVIETNLSDDFKLDFESIMDNRNLLLSFIKSYIKDKGADITPLKQLIRTMLDEDLLLNSSIEFGLCTVLYPSLKPVYIRKNDMGKDMIMDYLIASASCFPAFPVHIINNQSYIDGGYYDNLPIDMAIEDGIDEIIAVDLKMEATHKHYLNTPHILYNIPRHDLGKFLDFNEERIIRNKQLGYNDCMKLYNHYSGVRYTFNKYNNVLIDEFYKDLMLFEKQLRDLMINDLMIDFSKELMDSKGGQYLNKSDYFYLVVDFFMDYLNKEAQLIYNVDEILMEIKNKFIINHNKRFKFTDDLMNTIKNIGKKDYIKNLIQEMLESEGKADVGMFSSLFVKEMMMARFVYFLNIK